MFGIAIQSIKIKYKYQSHVNCHDPTDLCLDMSCYLLTYCSHFLLCIIRLLLSLMDTKMGLQVLSVSNKLWITSSNYNDEQKDILCIPMSILVKII